MINQVNNQRQLYHLMKFYNLLVDSEDDFLRRTTLTMMITIYELIMIISYSKFLNWICVINVFFHVLILTENSHHINYQFKSIKMLDYC